MTSDVDLPSERRKGRCMLKDCHSMGREEKMESVLRLVEAQIAGCVDLSPEEMVDAAFIMVNKINARLYEEEIH